MHTSMQVSIRSAVALQVVRTAKTHMESTALQAFIRHHASNSIFCSTTGLAPATQYACCIASC